MTLGTVVIFIKVRMKIIRKDNLRGQFYLTCHQLVSWLRLEYVHQLKKMRILSVLTHRVIPWVQNKKETLGAVTRAESGPAKEKKSGA